MANTIWEFSSNNHIIVGNSSVPRIRRIEMLYTPSGSVTSNQQEMLAFGIDFKSRVTVQTIFSVNH